MTSLANIKITSKKPRRSRRIAGLPPIIYSKANNLNQTTKCIECNEYYGRIESDNKCSYCFKGIKTMKDPNFQEKLNNYVKSDDDVNLDVNVNLYVDVNLVVKVKSDDYVNLDDDVNLDV